MNFIYITVFPWSGDSDLNNWLQAWLSCIGNIMEKKNESLNFDQRWASLICGAFQQWNRLDLALRGRVVHSLPFFMHHCRTQGSSTEKMDVLTKSWILPHKETGLSSVSPTYYLANFHKKKTKKTHEYETNEPVVRIPCNP